MCCSVWNLLRLIMKPFFPPLVFIFIFRNACIVNVFCFLFQHTARIIDLSQRRLPKPSQNHLDLTVHFLCVRKVFFGHWCSNLSLLSQTVEPIHANQTVNTCVNAEGKGREKKYQRLFLLHAWKTVSHHKSQAARRQILDGMWWKYTQKNKPNKDGEAIRTGRTGWAHV